MRETGVPISVCMIVRDEADVLARCLASAAPYADEILVGDTGSVDDTAAIARRHGARVFDVPWTDDFAAARNRVLDEAVGEWILVLDADEWIAGGPAPDRLRRSLRETTDEARTVELADRADDGVVRRHPLVRLFRNRPGHRYEGSFHEQITPALARTLGVERIAPVASGLVVGHDGYLAARRTRRDKARRNLEHLERRVRNAPDDVAARYFLARERLPVLHGRAVPGDHVADALEHLRAIDGAALAPALAIDAARLHAMAALAASIVDEAAAALDTIDDDGVATELLHAEILGARGAWSEAASRIGPCIDVDRTERGPTTDPSLPGPIARVRLAECLVRLGAIDRARQTCAEAAELPGGGAAPWVALGDLERRADDPTAALRAYVRGIKVDDRDPWAWLGLGLAFRHAGDAASALAPVENALRLAPGWNAAREALRAFSDPDLATDGV